MEIAACGVEFEAALRLRDGALAFVASDLYSIFIASLSSWLRSPAKKRPDHITAFVHMVGPLFSNRSDRWGLAQSLD
jgi:hypothetical protein